MPDILTHEVLSGVFLWQALLAFVAVVVALNTWTRISRARMMK